jgi:hypothetical protein
MQVGRRGFLVRLGAVLGLGAVVGSVSAEERPAATIQEKELPDGFFDPCTCPADTGFSHMHVFHDEGKASWDTALPAARGGGKVWGISTPNGHDPHIKPTVTGEATTYETYNKGSTLEALPEGKDKIRSKVMPARPLSWPILPRQSLK